MRAMESPRLFSAARLNGVLHGQAPHRRSRGGRLLGSAAARLLGSATARRLCENGTWSQKRPSWQPWRQARMKAVNI